jgi:hypothetical protein
LESKAFFFLLISSGVPVRVGDKAMPVEHTSSITRGAVLLDERSGSGWFNWIPCTSLFLIGVLLASSCLLATRRF